MSDAHATPDVDGDARRAQRFFELTDTRHMPVLDARVAEFIRPTLANSVLGPALAPRFHANASETESVPPRVALTVRRFDDHAHLIAALATACLVTLCNAHVVVVTTGQRQAIAMGKEIAKCIADADVLLTTKPSGTRFEWRIDQSHARLSIYAARDVGRGISPTVVFLCDTEFMQLRATGRFLSAAMTQRDVAIVSVSGHSIHDNALRQLAGAFEHIDLRLFTPSLDMWALLNDSGDSD